jgi:hypothetical protein
MGGFVEEIEIPDADYVPASSPRRKIYQAIWTGSLETCGHHHLTRDEAGKCCTPGAMTIEKEILAAHYVPFRPRLL